MGVTVKSSNNIPKLKRILKELGRSEIKVGIFGQDKYEYGQDADILTIAYVHEFGTTIRPKEAQFLTIPLTPEAKHRSARSFDDLQPIGLEDGSGVLARVDGDKIEPIFALVKSVTIPERSYIRTGFDKYNKKIGDKAEMLLSDVLRFDLDVDIFLDMIGKEFAGLIQKHMRTVQNPPNADSTKAVKGSSNPLHDSGRLIGAIRHEVE